MSGFNFNAFLIPISKDFEGPNLDTFEITIAPRFLAIFAVLSSLRSSTTIIWSVNF